MMTKTLLFVALLFFVPAVHASDCPPLPQVPEVTERELSFQAKWQWFAEPSSVYDWTGRRDSAPLGIGHLKITPVGDAYYDWPKKIVLPLWKTPGGPFWAWLRNGLVVPADGSGDFPLSGAGTVETDYEQQTFIISEKRDDWLKLRAKPGDEGEGWTHQSCLDDGSVGLEYQSWVDLIREKGDWLHFRAAVPHSLREGPGTAHPRVTWIGLNHELQLLEIKGDWMRVKVRQPAWHCVGPDQEFKGTEHTGWVKWRDNKIGPWLWYYTRGC